MQKPTHPEPEIESSNNEIVEVQEESIVFVDVLMKTNIINLKFLMNFQLHNQYMIKLLKVLQLDKVGEAVEIDLLDPEAQDDKIFKLNKRFQFSLLKTSILSFR
ncbi:hypothetical protein O6P43_001735 [Quillaja saponaria]|uniref:Uncharacterized protein n=1 Tax=Quillaja saponaria TaxID=32244 RepID=A0AAD7QLK5_QUISA|nr:hypothetical protein O6P43_001735 [Quillaja saponaria]